MKIKYLITVILLSAGWTVYAQNITKLEYSFDKFVKEGDGTIINMDGNTGSIDQEFPIDISELDPGQHTIFFVLKMIWGFGLFRQKGLFT